MIVRIEFFKNINELTLPIVRLTKSKNKMTGTATFIFIRPTVFNLSKIYFSSIDEMSLFWQSNKIKTTDIQIIFYKGKPFLLKAIFIFKNSKEWFQFLNFMQFYSKEVGLSFTEILV